MEDAGAQSLPDEQSNVPETPEDVAILFSWANMPGAKYRDFSASRREYRAQQRAKSAEQQRQAELEAARKLEATAQREFQEAERIREERRRAGLDAVEGPDAKSDSYELVRRVEEQALREREEAQRRQQSAEELRLQAQRARAEMLDARKRAEEQAARYAEAAAQYHDEVQAEAHELVPGETTDPYYYTGQVDPAYFAPTPGVRTAQATRISTERRAYVYPMHPGSDEHDSGTLQSYRRGTNFAPSPSQNFDLPAESTREPQQRYAAATRSEEQEFKPAVVNIAETESRDDGYYDGIETAAAAAQTEKAEVSAAVQAEPDLLIRPVARTPEPATVEAEAVPLPDTEPVLESSAEPPVRASSAPTAEPAAPVVKTEPFTHPIADLSSQSGDDQLSIMETFAQASDLFVAPVLSLSREIAVPSFLIPRNQAASEPVEPPPEPVGKEAKPPKADALAPARRQRDLRQDSHVRTARQRQTEYARQEVHDARLVPEVPPAWLKPEPTSAQRLDPGQIRAAVEARTARPGGRPYSRYAGVLAENRRRNNRALPPHLQDGGGFTAAPFTGPADPREAFLRQREELIKARLQRRGRVPAVPGPDTLQQSRERVAARWFALQGQMDAPYELTDTGNAAAVRTPTLCVLSLSGGVGKTSIVATLGRALSSMGERILLADINPHGLLPYYFGARELRPGTIRTFTPPAGREDATVSLVNYESTGVDQDPASQRRILEDIGRRARRAHRAVIDLGVDGTWLARRLSRLYPWILVPIAPDMNSVVTTKAMEELFHGVVGADGHPVRPYYVLNQFDPSLPLHLDVREVLRQSLGERLLSVMLHRSPAVSEALAEGMTVIDYAPHAPVTEDYMNLANWLRNVSAAGAPPVARWSDQ